MKNQAYQVLQKLLYKRRNNNNHTNSIITKNEKRGNFSDKIKTTNVTTFGNN